MNWSDTYFYASIVCVGLLAFVLGVCVKRISDVVIVVFKELKKEYDHYRKSKKAKDSNDFIVEVEAAIAYTNYENRVKDLERRLDIFMGTISDLKYKVNCLEAYNTHFEEQRQKAAKILKKVKK